MHFNGIFWPFVYETMKMETYCKQFDWLELEFDIVWNTPGPFWGFVQPGWSDFIRAKKCTWRAQPNLNFCLTLHHRENKWQNYYTLNLKSVLVIIFFSYFCFNTSRGFCVFLLDYKRVVFSSSLKVRHKINSLRYLITISSW